MNEGLDDGEAPNKKPEPVDGPLLSERDKLKIERRKRKDERQREVVNFNRFSSIQFHS
jgi:ATP-binding cassette subfamily F protein 3